MNIEQKAIINKMASGLDSIIANHKSAMGLISRIIHICESSNITALDIARIGMYAAQISMKGYPEVYRGIMNQLEKVGNL